MKRFLISLIACVCVSIGAWAAVTVTKDKALNADQYSANSIRIESSEAGEISSATLDGAAWYKMIFIAGPVNEADIIKINNVCGSSATHINLTQATGLDLSWLSHLTGSSIKAIGLPKGSSLEVSKDNIELVYASDFTGIINSANESRTDVEIDAYVQKVGGLAYLNTLQDIFLLQYRTVNLSAASGAVDETSEDYTKLTNTTGVTVVKVVAASETANAAGGSVETDVKSFAASKAKKLSEITSVKITGTITAADMSWMVENLTGLTSLDLSGAILADGISWNLPSTLTSLALPNGTTNLLPFNSTAFPVLKYAYSAASGSVPTTVKVLIPGGFVDATLEHRDLKTGGFKLAGTLNSDDTNFMTLLTQESTKIIDLSEADLSSLTVGEDIKFPGTNNGTYSTILIMPSDFDLSSYTYKQNSNSNDLAALVKYTDASTIEVADIIPSKLVLDNTILNGRTTLKIVPNDNFQCKVNKDVISQINEAYSTLTSVDLSTANLPFDVNSLTSSTMTLTNTHLVSLNLSNVSQSSMSLNVDACSALTTLNLSGATLASLDASVNSLTTVHLTGTKVNGTLDLSNSGLTTSGFVTSTGTEIGGDLNLTNSQLTSFSTAAKVSGSIYLNATSALSSVDLTMIQFPDNWANQVHIDKTVSEGNDALVNLTVSETVDGNTVYRKTIFVPNGFDSQNRIHPHTDVANNIAEAAGSGSTGLSDNHTDPCYISYDPETKIATVHATQVGHFADIMATHYASFPIGTTFKFDSESNINLTDLKALAGTINSADYSWRSNYYYVDLFDLPATSELCVTPSSEGPDAKGVIYQAIEWLRTENRQFKGLILPKDHTLYGSGTTLIQDDGVRTAESLATCSEFIAYYKTGESVAGDLEDPLLVAHVYNQSPASSAYQDCFDKMMELLDEHKNFVDDEEVNAIQATIYSISTNSINDIDISAIRENKENATVIKVVNNEMVGVPTTASIYAYPYKPGHFATAMSATNLQNAPTELLQLNGTVNDDDIEAVNSFDTDKTKNTTNGPRVLDMSNLSTAQITKEQLESITNKDIEFIILPPGVSKSVVCGSDYSDLASLKAVISSSETDLVAYVNVLGSLAEARYYATGGATDGSFYTPAVTGLTSVTLAGSLNAGDIAANITSHCTDTNGNWTAGNNSLKSIALNQEQGTITTIDLEDAVFPVQTDMNFSYAGLGSLVDITLPTSTPPSQSPMTLIPESCFEGITSFTDLCIPYNYTHIDNKALLNTYVSHITTTDANGALVDNGPFTYTFSKNLEKIGSKPEEADANGVYALSTTVFPQNRGVTDVYVLAHKVPKCYANAFPANMLYGWGGFKGGDFPYCREKYDNSNDGSLIFTVLHFPDEASFNAATDREESYEQMEKLYTDINKVYTKKEQTGAVDANGDPVAWPTFAELRRAYNQATVGAQWYDWNIKYDDQYSINGGNYIPVGSDEYAVVPDGTAPNVDKDYSFADYEGWHQFVLSMATYVEPDKTVVNDVIKNTYVEGPWYTLCIPFSLTVDQAYEILGVPASVEGVEENYLDGTMITDNTKKLPDVRTLQTVTRKPGKPNEEPNEVTLKFTQNLVVDGNYRYWNIDDETPNNSAYSGTGATLEGKTIAIRGGYPYLVKPYLPAGVVVKNLGKYIMTKFGNDFKQELSCINLSKCYQDLGEYSSSNKTGRFAKPYEHHKIQAALDDNDSSTDPYATHNDGKKYYYTFIGQFWTQPLPQYAFYMVETNEASTKNARKPQWYRYASGNKNYNWNQYKCIILPTQEVADAAPEGRSYLFTNSGLFRNNGEGKSVYPSSSGIDAQGGYKFDGQLYIEFLNGLDDAIFDETASARYVIEFDDAGVQEIVDDDSEVTAITSLDGEDILPAGKSLKVYNVAGQYVGQSLYGLAKGMYIVNGKKVLVK